MSNDENTGTNLLVKNSKIEIKSFNKDLSQFLPPLYSNKENFKSSNKVYNFNDESKQNDSIDVNKTKGDHSMNERDINDNEKQKNISLRTANFNALQVSQNKPFIGIENNHEHLNNKDFININKENKNISIQNEENNEKEAKEVSLKFFTQQFLDIGDIYLIWVIELIKTKDKYQLIFLAIFLHLLLMHSYGMAFLGWIYFCTQFYTSFCSLSDWYNPQVQVFV